MNRLVIFGTGDIAELAHFYFTSDSEYEIVAFTVDSEYISEGHFCGLPVVPFEEVVHRFPPDQYLMFVALAYSKVNEIRKSKFAATKALGYQHVSYISSKANVLTDAGIGQNCFILEDNTIQPFVVIGDNVTLWSGNHIGHHSEIQSHAFVSSHVVISGHVTIEEQCFIGVNSTLRDNIRVGARCVIGAGVLLLGNADPDGLYVGSRTERSPKPSSELRKI